MWRIDEEGLRGTRLYVCALLVYSIIESPFCLRRQTTPS